MNEKIFEILRNIKLRVDDIKNNKLSDKFYSRKDISEIKKSILKKLSQ